MTTNPSRSPNRFICLNLFVSTSISIFKQAGTGNSRNFTLCLPVWQVYATVWIGVCGVVLYGGSGWCACIFTKSVPLWDLRPASIVTFLPRPLCSIYVSTTSRSELQRRIYVPISSRSDLCVVLRCHKLSLRSRHTVVMTTVLTVE